METLKCTGLSKIYGNITALDNVDLELGEGKIIGLLGPNGSGKTTLIKLASRLLVPSSGKIEICGVEPSPETKAMVSYLPDRNSLPDWMKVKELVELYSDFFADFDVIRAENMLDSLNIDPNRQFKKMSKGKTTETIADEVEEELDVVRTICGVAGSYAPDYDVDVIYNALKAAERVSG